MDAITRHARGAAIIDDYTETSEFAPIGFSKRVSGVRDNAGGLNLMARVRSAVKLRRARAARAWNPGCPSDNEPAEFVAEHLCRQRPACDRKHGGAANRQRETPHPTEYAAGRQRRVPTPALLIDFRV